MSNPSVSRSNSFSQLPPVSSSSPVSRSAPLVQQQVVSTPISQEAQQLVRQSGQPSAPTTVATDQDIQNIRNEVESLSNSLPTGNEHTLKANALQDSPLNKGALRDAIAFLGDHPQANTLSQELGAAGDDRDKLMAVRNKLVDTIRSQGREVSQSRQQAHERVDEQMLSEKGPTDDRWMIRKALLGGYDRSTNAQEQQQRLKEHGTTHLQQSRDFQQLASRLQDSAVNKPAIRAALASLGDAPEVNSLRTELSAAGDDRDKLIAVRNKLVDALRGEGRRLEKVGQGELQASERIGHLSGEGAEELIANTSLGTSLVSSTNSLVKLVSDSSEGFMGAATTAVGVGFGGLQILTEAVALRRNAGRLSEALSRQEQADLVLLPAGERGKKIAELQDQIQSLSQPKWYRTQAGREQDIAKLQAQVNALQAMGNTETPPEARAIAQQVKDSASIGFKALRVAKNIVGIAAGAVAVAVAVGALATPVGWAAAAVAVTATAGLWLYNKYQTSSKESKIESLMQNRSQIAHKLADLQGSPAARDPNSTQGKALADLQQLQQKNLLQLLTVSPRHAASEIISGLKATPPDVQMRILATQVLNLPESMAQGPINPQQEDEIREYLMRGLPMQPKL